MTAMCPSTVGIGAGNPALSSAFARVGASIGAYPTYVPPVSRMKGTNQRGSLRWLRCPHSKTVQKTCRLIPISMASRLNPSHTRGNCGHPPLNAAIVPANDRIRTKTDDQRIVWLAAASAVFPLMMAVALVRGGVLTVWPLSTQMRYNGPGAV